MQTKFRTLLMRALVALALVATLTIPSPHQGAPVAFSVVTSTTTTLAGSSSTSEQDWSKLEQAIKNARLDQFYATMSAPKPPAPKAKPKVPVAKNETAQPRQTYDSGSLEAMIMSIFGSAGQSAINVAQCESTMNPSAVSKGGGNWGLFQINSVHRDDFEAVTGQPWSEVLNATYNTQYAKHLYDSLGWGPWACKWAA